MTILVIEDDENDALLLAMALRRSAIAPLVTVVNSAEAAMRHLTGAGEYADRNQFPLPSLIILDLSLPGVCGLDFLGWLQQQPVLSRIPAVVLSGSPFEAVVGQAYQRGAKTFFTKPRASELDKLAHSIVLYWSTSISPASPVRDDDAAGSDPLSLGM